MAQNKSVLIAFKRWQMFRKVERRVRAYRRRELMSRFKEWRALGAWKFRVRSAAVQIQKMMRGYLTRKHIKPYLALRKYQLDVVTKVCACVRACVCVCPSTACWDPRGTMAQGWLVFY